MQNSGLAIHVVDAAVSVLKKHFTVPIEDVPSFKNFDNRKFGMLLKALFTMLSPALQTALCHFNSQQLPPVLLFCVCLDTCHESNIQNGSNLKSYVQNPMAKDLATTA